MSNTVGYPTIATQAAFMANQLKAWAGFQGGECQIARDVGEMWAWAYKQSQTPRLILAWVGDTVRGDFPVAAAIRRVDRLWNLAVTRGIVYSQDRGADFVSQNQNAAPFYDLVEEARDMVRTFESVTLEDPVDFRDVQTMTVSLDALINGYLITYSTAIDLPGIGSVPTISAPPISGPGISSVL